MEFMKEKYKDILNKYISASTEDALYQANELSKQFIYRSISPEVLVAFHHEIVQELTCHLPPEEALKIINHCMAYLVQILVNYGIYYGSSYKKDAMDGWHNALLNLRTSLNSFENKHKIILEIIPTAVITVNRDGIITFINKKIEEQFNVQFKDVVGKHYLDVTSKYISLEFNDKNISIILETLRTGKLFRNIEIEHPQGKFYKISTSIIRDEAGEISEVVSSLEDITQNKKMEQAALQNEKLAAVGTLSAGIAHEIRNPLTAIRGFIQLLQPELEHINKGEYLEIILEEIDRTNTVLKDFLSFAKPKQPKLTYINVKDLLKELRLLTEGEALLQEINLEFTYSLDDIPNIYIDKDQIKQVLLNIINNAFDAVKPSDGIIKVSAVWEPLFDNVSIIIKDNGIGMNKETTSRIFDPFFTTKENGTGLGMAVTYQIIKNHGGEIHVDSFPGCGSTFTITFPLENKNEVS